MLAGVGFAYPDRFAESTPLSYHLRPRRQLTRISAASVEIWRFLQPFARAARRPLTEFTRFRPPRFRLYPNPTTGLLWLDSCGCAFRAGNDFIMLLATGSHQVQLSSDEILISVPAAQFILWRWLAAWEGRAVLWAVKITSLIIGASGLIKPVLSRSLASHLRHSRR